MRHLRMGFKLLASDAWSHTTMSNSTKKPSRINSPISSLQKYWSNVFILANCNLTHQMFSKIQTSQNKNVANIEFKDDASICNTLLKCKFNTVTQQKITCEISLASLYVNDWQNVLWHLSLKAFFKAFGNATYVCCLRILHFFFHCTPDTKISEFNNCLIIFLAQCLCSLTNIHPFDQIESFHCLLCLQSQPRSTNLGLDRQWVVEFLSTLINAHFIWRWHVHNDMVLFGGWMVEFVKCPQWQQHLLQKRFGNPFFPIIQHIMTWILQINYSDSLGCRVSQPELTPFIVLSLLHEWIMSTWVPPIANARKKGRHLAMTMVLKQVEIKCFSTSWLQYFRGWLLHDEIAVLCHAAHVLNLCSFISQNIRCSKLNGCV